MNKIELVECACLKPALYNPREADKERLALVELSLRKLGFILPLVATRDGEILSGHQRYAVAVAMGAKRLPVMFVDVKDTARRGMNILFNRATNDIPVQSDERDMSAAMAAVKVRELAASFPDIEPDSQLFFPCLNAIARPVVDLAKQNVRHFVRHAANVGRMLLKCHINLPIVATQTGEVVNGIGRLEAAARKGRQSILVIEIDEARAELARAMLNLLSMDFRFTGENANFLRYGAFRREWLRRTHLGRAFILPVYRHKKLADVKIDDKFMGKWRSLCGNTILDFGSGRGDEADMLRKHGVDVTEFEPYPVTKSMVDREKGRRSALDFLGKVRGGKKFSAIFISSVLNSVPFPEDREHVMRIIAALCEPDTVVIAAARSTKEGAWKTFDCGESASCRGSRTCIFRLAMEPGVQIGDITGHPKIQKFYKPEEWQEFISRFFGEIRIGHSDGMVTAICRKPLWQPPEKIGRAVAFEFDLPYPENRFMGLKHQALEAFSHRLGVDLEACL